MHFSLAERNNLILANQSMNDMKDHSQLNYKALLRQIEERLSKWIYHVHRLENLIT